MTSFTFALRHSFPRVLQFHLHWGDRESRGSEHTVDGMKYMCELHIVHYNVKYTVAEALVATDGLAVLGIIFEHVDGTSNPFLKVISPAVFFFLGGGGLHNVTLISSFSLNIGFF